MTSMITGGGFAAVVVVVMAWSQLFDLSLVGQPQYMEILKPLLALVGSMLLDWLNPRSQTVRVAIVILAAAGFIASSAVHHQFDDGLTLVNAVRWYADPKWLAVLTAYFCLGVALWPMGVYLTRRWMLPSRAVASTTNSAGGS